MELNLCEEIMSLKQLSVLLLSAVLLSGCAATQMAISKRNLDVQTKMSNTVFLNPVEDSKKTVYVQVKNTSDKQSFAITEELKKDLENKGYQIVNSLNSAHYLLQANILQVGKTDPSAAERAFAGGYGSSLSAVLSGGTAGALLGNGRGSSILAGGLLGGVIDTVANAAIKDVTYTAMTDLQISERAGKGAKIQQTDESTLQQGTSSISRQTSSSQAGWMRYQTRILSSAEKVNLDFNDALPMLESGLAGSIAGIF